MKYFICVGHANYGGGVISSADGTSKGGVNEYKYNKELAPYVCKWLKVAGHEATLCIAPEGQLHSLNDEIKYFIEEENKQNYDLSVQLHLNAFNGEAYGCEVYCYNANGLPEAQRISAKLGTVWHDRGAEERPGLYWTRKTKAKAVLVESFFCDNKDDYAKAKKLGMDASNLPPSVLLFLLSKKIIVNITLLLYKSNTGFFIKSTLKVYINHFNPTTFLNIS